MPPATPCPTWRRYRELLLRNEALAALRCEHMGSAVTYRRQRWLAPDEAFDREDDCQRALRALRMMLDAMQTVLRDSAVRTLERATTDEERHAARLLLAQADAWWSVVKTLEAIVP